MRVTKFMKEPNQTYPEDYLIGSYLTIVNGRLRVTEKLYNRTMQWKKVK